MKKIKIVVCLWIMVYMLTGCQKNTEGQTRIVLTTGFEEDEIFRIERVSCTIPEVMVYLTNTQNEYESVFGEEIWDAEYEGETLEENIKETVLARIARIKALTLFAQERGVTLEADEKLRIAEAASKYYESLNDKEKELLGVDEELIYDMYEEYALASKIHEDIISGINPEISDDEARTITVEHILIKTYRTDEQGMKVSFSEDEKRKAYAKVNEAYKRAKAGEEFASLISEYSEDENQTYSFGKGTMDTAFEEAAFNLANDEISKIIETQHGYHIIKCVSTFDKDETEKNKVKIIEQRQKEAFNKEYSDFVEGLTKNIHEKRWNNIGFIKDAEVTTNNFFDIYNSVCAQK